MNKEISSMIIDIILSTTGNEDVRIMGELVKKHKEIGSLLEEEVDKYMISERDLTKLERKDANNLIEKMNKIIEILK